MAKIVSFSISLYLVVGKAFNSLLLLALLVLQLLVPILINCLLDPMQMKTSNPLTKTLHAHALQTLTRIGTQYPQVMENFKC